MEQNLLEIAAKAMKITVQEAKQHYKEVPEINGFYFWNPIRGGISVLIDQNGEKLAATSVVNFSEHVEEFKKGRRN